MNNRTHKDVGLLMGTLLVLLAASLLLFNTGCAARGFTGPQGPAGQDGAPGEPGPPGADGMPGAPAIGAALSAVINPCGDDPNVTYEEVLLKFSDGTILAYFAGSGGFLVALTPGTYVTTDGTNCHFTVYNTGAVQW